MSERSQVSTDALWRSKDADTVEIYECYGLTDWLTDWRTNWPRYVLEKIDQNVLSLELGMKEKSLAKISLGSELEERVIYLEFIRKLDKSVLFWPANIEYFWLEVNI